MRFFLYEYISHLPNLKSVSDKNGFSFWNEIATNYGLSQFKNIESIEIFCSSSLKESFINFLKDQTNLKKIKIFNYRVQYTFEDMLEIINTNKNTLTSITISDFVINISKLSLSSFPNLESIDILQCLVEGKRLAKCFSHPKLKELNIPLDAITVNEYKKIILGCPLLENVKIPPHFFDKKYNSNYNLKKIPSQIHFHQI